MVYIVKIGYGTQLVNAVSRRFLNKKRELHNLNGFAVEWSDTTIFNRYAINNLRYSDKFAWEQAKKNKINKIR